jgi:hypothetical protein
MWSPIPCLNNLVASHGTQKCCSVRFLSPKEVLAKSPEMVWDATCNWEYNENQDSD